MSRSYKVHVPDGVYFMTFATVGWVDVFTRRCYADVMIDSLRYCQENKGLELYGWCIMSNHLHLIGRSTNSDLPGTMRDMKKFTSKKLLRDIRENYKESRRDWMMQIFRKAGEYNSNNQEYQFWRKDYRPIVIYSRWVFDQKLNYIHKNPVKAGYVERPEHYIYSSARDYAGRKGPLQLNNF